MQLHAVESKTLPDQVFEQLAREIVVGRYAAGSTLPSERSLSEVFEVNRHVVREAVKRLEQVGLVKVSQGGGTRVLDFRRTAGLDLLSLIARYAEIDASLVPVWRSVFEMRAAIGADLARLCAQRASRAVKDDLVEIAEQLRDVPPGPELLAADMRFWERMLDGADNVAYRLAFNSLIRAAVTVPELSAHWLHLEHENGDYRAPIAAAIAAGDAATAEAATRIELGAVVETLDDFLATGAAQAAAGD